MSAATKNRQAAVEIPWDLFSTLTALASYAADSPQTYEAHEIRDALALLADDLDQLELETMRAWGINAEERTAHANEMIEELMERAGHA